jgi:hypothetical protein
MLLSFFSEEYGDIVNKEGQVLQFPVDCTCQENGNKTDRAMIRQ